MQRLSKTVVWSIFLITALTNANSCAPFYKSPSDDPCYGLQRVFNTTLDTCKTSFSEFGPRYTVKMRSNLLRSPKVGEFEITGCQIRFILGNLRGQIAMTITSKEMTASTKTSVDGEAIVEIYRLSKGSTHLHYSFLLEFFLLKEDSYREKAELNAEGSIEIDPFLVAHCPDEAELAVSIR